MKKTFIAMLALVLCTLASCEDDIDLKQQITVSTTKDSLSCTINKTSFSVGETLRIELSYQSTNNNSAVALYWDDVEVEHITEFPYIYEKRLEEVGMHNLKLKVGQILEDGSISFESNFSENINITVTE